MQHTINYIDNPLSFQAKLIHIILGILNMNKKMEKRIIENKYTKNAAKIPRSYFKKYDIQALQQNHTWEIKRKGSDPDLIILYLHGGAYYANITTLHWRLIEQLVLATDANVIVPDYPLAPEYDCLKVYRFMDTLYKRLVIKYPDKKIVFMGDSAGGGIALGFAQKIKNEDIKQPDEIILFSPYLDVSMSDPDIAKIEKEDNILNVNGLRYAGKMYAGSLDVTDYRVSPLYGDFKNLARITIFTGTKDVLIADARKCKLIMEEQGIRFNYFEYRDMFHDWAIIPWLKESQDVISKVKKILNK
jgi:acetyl esterase/lipase